MVQQTQRTWKGESVADSRYLFGGASDSRLGEANAQTGSVSASFVTDMGGLLAVRGTSTTYSYFNGHGDLVQRANAAGAILEATPFTYDEFGVPQGNGAVPYGWTGQQRRPTMFQKMWSKDTWENIFEH